MKTIPGKLYLIPATISDCEVNNAIPSNNLKIIGTLDIFIAENISTARKYLRKSGYDKNFNDVTFFILDEHSRDSDIESFLDGCLQGRNIGLMSESGAPCIADPGSMIVSMAHRKGIRVVPLAGPSSIFLALMASGFNGQNFVFHGYMPIEKSLLVKKIRDIENCIYRDNQTQIFIEAPYRNNRLTETLLSVCKPSTMLCIASELMSENESIITKSIGGWKTTTFNLNKRNSVFLLFH